MKKLLLSLVLVAVLGFASKAQTEKGNWMVGAQAANINYNYDSTYDVFRLTLTPQAGYFVKNNLAIGAKLSLDLVSSDGTTAVWSVGPFVRGYFGGNEKSKFFAEANPSLGRIQLGGEGFTMYNLGASVGYAYFITKNIGLETGLSYNYSNATDGGGLGSTDLGLNIGFQIYLGKKKK